MLHEIGNKNFSDAPQNIGFVTIGLFYGMGDFGASLCAGVNCGYDAEAVGGALGALLGIRAGRSGLPEEWLRPIGDILIGGMALRDFDAPRSLTETAEQTYDVGLRLVAARCPDVAISDEPQDRGQDNREQEEAAGAGNSLPASDDASLLEIGDAPLTAPEPGIVAPPAPIAATGGEEEAATIAAPVREMMNLSAPPVAPDFDDSPAAPAPELIEDVHASAAVAETDAAADAIQNPKSKIQNQFRPQSVSAEEPASIASGILDAQTAAPVYAKPIEADPISAIAWTDNTLVKPLLVTPPMAQIGQAGAFRVVLDCGDSPAVAYNELKTLGFYVLNRGGAAFSGRIVSARPVRLAD